MIAITNGKVMTITQGTSEHGTVLVEDGRIVAVGEEVEVSEDAEVYNATGKVVMPGLIDAHCHVGIFLDGIGWEYSDGNEMTPLRTCDEAAAAASYTILMKRRTCDEAAPSRRTCGRWTRCIPKTRPSKSWWPPA